MNDGSSITIIMGTTIKEGGTAMQLLRRKIIELIQQIEDADKLKAIYQFIRGIISG